MIKMLKSLAETTLKIESMHRDRDKLIYELFTYGVRQRAIAKQCKLSISRVKAICGEQKKLQPVYLDEKWRRAEEIKPQ